MVRKGAETSLSVKHSAPDRSAQVRGSLDKTLPCTLMAPGASKGWLVVGAKADCLTRKLGLWVECPPLGSF